VPSLRAFRGLRFDASVAGDLARLVCPPYDVISSEVQQALLARDPHNSVRLELPPTEPGDDELARYRRAAGELARWRTEGALRKDGQPGIYVYEQTYLPPGAAQQRTQRGFFARLKLEPFGPDGGVRPHEATLSGPKEDRLRLLRATGTNTSAVMALYRSGARSAALIDELTARAPDAEVCDDDGVRHRLWYVPLAGDSGEAISELLTLAGERPLVIADGHHRYEIALRYRDERNRACEEDPPFDYVLSALFDVETEPLSILPTHRLVREGPAGEALLAAARGWFLVEPLASGDELVRRMADGAAGGGRFGVYSAGRAAVLQVDPTRKSELLGGAGPANGGGGAGPANGGGGAVRDLDVTLLAAALGRIVGLPEGHGAGERLGYTKDSREAVDAVEAGRYASAFLLDPTPVRDVAAVAEAGELMPQKSTYFYPKIVTGLIFNPLES
jgi:uncharacterized protein (DUF1015 family)